MEFRRPRRRRYPLPRSPGTPPLRAGKTARARELLGAGPVNVRVGLVALLPLEVGRAAERVGPLPLETGVGVQARPQQA
ncbi:hypothetical protein, partial [Rubrivirga sp.]|uniref:hypothetical protein n=1 Tax=Rubrivirga sp. TaxID=1885344 RepID=UPI003C74FCD6